MLINHKQLSCDEISLENSRFFFDRLLRSTTIGSKITQRFAFRGEARRGRTDRRRCDDRSRNDFLARRLDEAFCVGKMNFSRGERREISISRNTGARLGKKEDSKLLRRSSFASSSLLMISLILKFVNVVVIRFVRRFISTTDLP